MSSDAHLRTDDRFAVGEVAILLWDDGWPDYPLCECTVIAPARLFRVSYKSNGSMALADMLRPQYLVRDEAGEEWCVAPEMLRKKRPPQDWAKLCELDSLPETLHVH